MVLIGGKGNGLPRSKEEAIKLVIKVEVMEVRFVSFAKKVEEERFALEGNLTFEDFGVKERDFRGPFLIRMPEVSVGKEMKRGRIT